MVQLKIDEQDARGYETFDGFIEVFPEMPMFSSDEKFLNVVNKILADQRHRAWDHEAKHPGHRGEREMFFGAALIKTADGRFYTAANVHLQHSAATRNCAEANAITEASQKLGVPRLKVGELWFMGGKGDMSRGLTVLPKEWGRRYTPCGSCLDIIHDHRLVNGKHTKVHMLPLNDGESWLIPDDGRPEDELMDNQVMTRPISTLFPHITLFIEDREGRLKRDIEHGWRRLQNASIGAAIAHATLAGPVEDLDRLEKNGVNEATLQEAINRIMHETLAAEFHKDAPRPLKKGTIAIVRTEAGHYHLGTYYDDGNTVGTPSESYNAIQNAGRNKITDIFILSVDFEQMPEVLSGFKDHPKSDVAIEVPSGEVRDRIFKARPKGEGEVKDLSGRVMLKENGPNVHLLQLNDLKGFDPARHIISKPVKELLPYAFISPKSQGAGR